MNHGNRFTCSINQLSHNWLIDDSIHSSRVINDCNNSLPRLKKKGTRIINHDSTNIVAIK